MARVRDGNSAARRFEAQSSSKERYGARCCAARADAIMRLDATRLDVTTRHATRDRASSLRHADAMFVDIMAR